MAGFWGSQGKRLDMVPVSEVCDFSYPAARVLEAVDSRLLHDPK